MTSKYGLKSQREFDTLHPLLQRVLLKVLETDDHSIEYGVRSRDEQEQVFRLGNSKVDPASGEWPHMPSKPDRREYDQAGVSWAVDICPWLDGVKLATDEASFKGPQMAQFAWFLRKVYEAGLAELAGTGFKLRFGIDWDGDTVILTDQSFQDWFHVELRKAA